MQWIQLQSHYEMCPRYPVNCTYNCGQLLPRNQIADHIGRQGTCPISLLECDFKDSGCQFRGTRIELLKHIEISTASHLSLIMMEQVRTKQSVDNTKQELQTTKQRMESELATTRTKLEGDQAATRDELAATRGELAATKQKLADTEQKLADVELKLSEELNRRSLSLPPHQPEQFIHAWRIEKWSQKVSHETGFLIPSKTFYVYPGYHLHLRGCGRVSPGDAVSHLGVYLCPSRGKFDFTITWPFPFTFVLEVVDQQPDGKNISRTYSPPHTAGLQSPMSSGVGTEKIASYETLNSRCYVKADTILIKLTVRQEEIQPTSCRQQ